MPDRDHFKIPWIHILSVFLFVMVDMSALCAQDLSVKEKSALLADDCRTDPAKSWTPQERWVWNQVCRGENADFNMASGYGGFLDPAKRDKEWPLNRVLSPAFLETILLREPYRGALARHGVHIHGAWFKERLDLSDSTVTHELALEGCRFESEVDLRHLRTSKNISLNGSKFTRSLFVDGLQAERNFSLRFAELDHVVLHGAKIGGDLDMDRSTVAIELDMSGLQVGKSLSLTGGAKFAQVYLRGAKIGDDLSANGSTFTGKLDMSGLQVGKSLSLRSGFAAVGLSGARIGENVDVLGSTFTGKLDMSGLQAGKTFSLTSGAKFAEVDLYGARIADNLYVGKATFTGRLDMSDLQVGKTFSLTSGAKFAEVDLSGARIGDGSISGATFTGRLNMNDLQVTQRLSMGDKATFAEVTLRGARIGDGYIRGAIFTGTLDMTGLQAGKSLSLSDKATFAGVELIDAKIGGDLYMHGAIFEKPLTLTFTKIGGNLDLSDSTFDSVDLTGTHVSGTFILGPPPTRWAQKATLTLRNAEVGVLPDPDNAWPDNLELDGFVYTRLGNVPGTDIDATERAVSRLLAWLEKHKPYYPQPYEQLAVILQKEGLKDEAENVLYASKNRELRETTGQSHRLFLRFQKYFIGYKYRTYYTVYWVIGFIVLGMVVLRLSKQGPINGMPYGITYSLDMLLPIIRLRDKHYQIDLNGWARYYFYFHKMMGYVLASFLIAGLTGLTK